MSLQWTNSHTIAADVLDELGLEGATDFNRAVRHVKQAMLELGHHPYYEVKAIQLPHDCGRVAKPDDFLSVRSLYYCQNNTLVEAAYQGAMPENLFNPDGCCNLYQRNTATHRSQNAGGIGGLYIDSATVVVGESPTHFFITQGDHTCYESAVLAYNGYHYNEDGSQMIHVAAAPGIRAYVYHKLLKRLRNRVGRATIPLEEVKTAELTKKQAMARSYGNLNITPMPVLKEWALANFGIRYDTPKTRLNN